MSEQMRNGHLSFEWDPSGEKVEIHATREGLERLAEHIQSLLDRDAPDDSHLMTPDWGGSDLSSELQNANATLVNHVKIFRWK
jgi:hypothetical protein